MAPLLSDQERIFINKFVYRFEPIDRGDVVVFWYPLDRSKSFIKRVVGLPGETVEIRKGIVYVNGSVAARAVRSAAVRRSDRLSARRKVPRAQLLCDGRSPDQLKRFTSFWYSASHFIYGRAVFAYWPVDHFGSLSATRRRKRKRNEFRRRIH